MARVKRRRSLRGLAGSPAEHQISMKSWSEVASHDFDEAAKLLEGRAPKGAGECKYALSWWSNGQLALGYAEAHLDEASKITTGASMLPVRKRGSDARQLFEAKCLVGSGGLSGARRRRRK